MITTKTVDFVVFSIFLFLTGTLSGLGSEHILVHLSNSVSGFSENNIILTATETISTETDNTTSPIKNNNNNNTNTTSTSTTSDINGSLTTLTPGGPQGLEDRRHAPS